MAIYDLRVTVERIEGRSVCGLEPGDYFELTESSRVRIPEGRHFCLYALSAVLPLLLVTQMGRMNGLDAINGQSLAVPIVATIVGCLALIAAVPITTGLAAMLLSRIPASALPDSHGHQH